MEQPQQLKNIDWQEVIEMAEVCLVNDNEDSDNGHYLYEAVMEAVYGKDIWDYINNRD